MKVPVLIWGIYPEWGCSCLVRVKIQMYKPDKGLPSNLISVSIFVFTKTRRTGKQKLILHARKCLHILILVSKQIVTKIGSEISLVSYLYEDCKRGYCRYIQDIKLQVSFCNSWNKMGWREVTPVWNCWGGSSRRQKFENLVKNSL